METETSAQQRKRERVIKRIYEMIKDKKAVFLTMSFNDDIYKNTSTETRKRYIKNYLKKETAQYITNIDYGAKKGREHYHAIVRANTLKKESFKGYYSKYEPIKNNVNLKAYKYGNIQADFIGLKYGFNNDDEIKQTALNLYNHSIKESTRNNKIIYSRKEPTEKQQYKRLLRLSKTIKPKTDKEPLINDEIINELIEIENYGRNQERNGKDIFYNLFFK